ncbi:MAG: hypothetical protein ACW99G_01170 [Candidatus Thorarchaeota archaeon]|jgi:hypothetical protein
MARSGASGNIKHANRHVDGGVDEIDGDLIDITFTPSTYTPDDSPAEANDLDDLAAHLAGIDNYLSNVVQSDSYIFAYDTTTQSIVTEDTYQNVTFSNNTIINGWGHTPGSADFVASEDGTHYIVVTGNVEKSGGSSPVASIRMTVNNIEIPGSEFGMDLTSNNTSFVVTRNLMAALNENDILRVQFASNTTTADLKAGPNPAGATVNPSITLTMQRVT